jgi:hypothetical protein
MFLRAFFAFFKGILRDFLGHQNPGSTNYKSKKEIEDTSYPQHNTTT